MGVGAELDTKHTIQLRYLTEKEAQRGSHHVSSVKLAVRLDPGALTTA